MKSRAPVPVLAAASLLALTGCSRGRVAADLDAYSYGVAGRAAAMAAWIGAGPEPPPSSFPSARLHREELPAGASGEGDEKLQAIVSHMAAGLDTIEARRVEVLRLEQDDDEPQADLRFTADGRRQGLPATARMDVAVSFQRDSGKLSVESFQVLRHERVLAGRRALVNRAPELGFTHPHRAASGLYPTSAVPGFHAAPGCAVADLDADGWPDVVIADGGRDHLYWNHGGTWFEDGSEAAGILDAGDGRGVLAYDVEADGDLDLLVVNADRDPDLYLNEGTRTFVERGASLGLTGVVQGTSAAAADVDGDGSLDVFIACYGRAPQVWPSLFGRNGEPDRLFVRRHGRYLEMALEAGAGDEGWGLACAFADADGDGDQDLYVANDFGRNTFLRNRSTPGSPRFRDVTFTTLTVDRGFGMSAAWGDYDGDLDLDLYVGNYYWEGRYVFSHPDFPLPPFPAPLMRGPITERLQAMTRGNSLLRCDGPRYAWQSADAGVADGGWAWGSGFFDWDDDGDLDILSGNGWISGQDLTDVALAFWTRMVSDYEAMQDGSGFVDIGGRSLHGRERERLFVNLLVEDGTPRFVEAAFASGIDTTADGRGLAFGDLDRDGDVDAVLASHRELPIVLRNEGERRASWIELALEGRASACGAAVLVSGRGHRTLRHLACGDTFLSSSEPVVHVGLGGHKSAVDIEIRWPGGGITRHSGVTPGARYRAREDPPSLAPEAPPADAPSGTPAEASASAARRAGASSPS